jgi:Bacterial membrane protein YfhO
VSSEANGTNDASPGLFVPGRWGWHDAIAILVWTAAIALYFWDAVSLRGALFYFDITEINYPYRHFFAEELRAGRFSRWCPGLYCGLPLYSESQAGYLHPFKYLFYPWMETWKALNFDTVLSIWLTGAGCYCWLRRHVGPTAALSGAAIFGLSGFTWGHLVHTSMINALASVPFVIWGLEWSWSSGRFRGVVLGGCAIAFQTFAGHLQDVILTAGLVGFYGLYRAATESGRARRVRAIGMAAALVGFGVLLSAVQWVPSKELLDRSPRAGGLSWRELTFGSWHPELLPTFVIREAYGTRARDTDWTDGFYPYHEMNTYVGLIAIVLAVAGGGGKSARDRWVTFWALLVGLSLVLMLGKFTFLFDFAHKVPIVGSSREPVRFHLWAAMGVAALAAVGVERLGKDAGVSLRPGLIVAAWLIVLCIPILFAVYTPVWVTPYLWSKPRNILQFRWLGRELLIGLGRTVILCAAAWFVAGRALRTTGLARRGRWVLLLPLLIIADLLSSHWYDVPTVSPRYWTEPPESVVRLKADPSLIRIFGKADKSAAEPGYVSERIDFLEAREQLDWSLGLAWNIPGSKGETPIIPLRYLNYTDRASVGGGRFDIEGVTHVLTGRRWKERILPAKCDVRLMPWLTEKNEMAGGKDLIVVGALGHVLHFRMFDGDGKMVVDTDERRLTERTRQIEDLRKQLLGLWPPHELSESEKTLLSSAVSAIVRQTIPVPAVRAGGAYIHRNKRALPRARLAGRPMYVRDQAEAVAAIDRLTETDELRDVLIVEDPTRPLPDGALVTGTARIVQETPEQLVVETDAAMPAYLVVSDSFDPGWSATIDGGPATIYPAYCAFRAVFLPRGKHSVVFQYSPAGFKLGLVISLCGMLAGLVLWFWPRRSPPPSGEHTQFDGPPHFRIWYLAALVAIVLGSIPGLGPDGRITTQSRWTNSFHRFTWDSGIKAMEPRSDRERPAQPSTDERLEGVKQ